ncbi:MAG: hypothetical protein M3R24_28435 [Chloroflexota bacterium]|nr:hypothetical protein [Chloroflexota bacterium]
MADRRIAFKCWHADCANDPPLEVMVAVGRGRSSKGIKQITKYCERGHLNAITLPSTWNVRELVLGDDGVIGEAQGTPVLQGKQA